MLGNDVGKALRARLASRASSQKGLGGAAAKKYTLRPNAAAQEVSLAFWGSLGSEGF